MLSVERSAYFTLHFFGLIIYGFRFVNNLTIIESRILQFIPYDLE